MQLEVDGAPESRLLTGSHSFSAAFDACLIDGLVGTSLHGEASGTYSYAGDYDFDARLAVRTMGGSLLALASDLHSVSVDGSLAVNSVSSGTAYTTGFTYTTTFAPAAGLRLVNGATGNALTFGSGSFSSHYDAATQSGRSDFDALEVEINGVHYRLDGSLHWTANSWLSYRSGIVHITSGGVLHAYLAGSGALRVEVLVPLERL